MRIVIKHLAFILFTLLIIIILGGCGIDEELTCFNYCSDALYYSGFSGIVINKETRQPINGATVTLTESKNQRCDTCVILGTIILSTDAEGWFRAPSEIHLPDLYVMNVVIEAENCVRYDADYEAFYLVGTEFPGEVFELSCS